jgi:hypothetical protein
VGSAYRSGIDLSSADVPAEAARAADESIGAAWGVAQSLPQGGGALLAEAQSAFVDAFRISNVLGLVVAIGAAAAVLVTLRSVRPAPTGDAEAVPVSDPELGTADQPAVDPALAFADADETP